MKQLVILFFICFITQSCNISMITVKHSSDIIIDDNTTEEVDSVSTSLKLTPTP